MWLEVPEMRRAHFENISAPLSPRAAVQVPIQWPRVAPEKETFLDPSLHARQRHNRY